MTSINEIRQSFLNELNQSPDDFYPDDVDRIKHCDWIIGRFLEYNDGNVKEATKQFIEAMKWRKIKMVNELKASDFPMEYFQCGGIFIHAKDKNGARLLILRVKVNKKVKEWNEELKKFIIYLIELVDREQDENKLTLIFDCAGAGLSNVDTDLLSFIISLLRNYYPLLLSSVLVHELPWVLNFVLKLVQSWLPKHQSDMIHPITKKELNDYIDPDQLPDFLDGTCDLPYKVVPKDVLPAAELAKQLTISKSACDKLIKHLEPYLM